MEALICRWADVVGKLQAMKPIHLNPDGLLAASDFISEKLKRLGFSVEKREAELHAPILIAKKYTDSSSRWLGITGHYDIEVPAEGWESDPFEVCLRSERYYGCGTGDNLGPLVQRLLALEEVEPTVNIVWIIQGQEEIGSPFAHEQFPDLRLPEVNCWLEETGYFLSENSQRFLVRRPEPMVQMNLDALQELALKSGVDIVVEERYLNKAFGQDKCPFLTHLVGQEPYVSFGLNDTQSRIHQPNESIPTYSFGLSYAQFQKFVTSPHW